MIDELTTTGLLLSLDPSILHSLTDDLRCIQCHVIDMTGYTEDQLSKMCKTEGSSYHCTREIARSYHHFVSKETISNMNVYLDYYLFYKIVNVYLNC